MLTDVKCHCLITSATIWSTLHTMINLDQEISLKPFTPLGKPTHDKTFLYSMTPMVGFWIIFEIGFLDSGNERLVSAVDCSSTRSTSLMWTFPFILKRNSSHDEGQKANTWTVILTRFRNKALFRFCKIGWNAAVVTRFGEIWKYLKVLAKYLANYFTCFVIWLLLIAVNDPKLNKPSGLSLWNQMMMLISGNCDQYICECIGKKGIFLKAVKPRADVIKRF